MCHLCVSSTSLSNLGFITSVSLSADGSHAAIGGLRPAVLRVFHLGSEGIQAWSSASEGEEEQEDEAGEARKRHSDAGGDGEDKKENGVEANGMAVSAALSASRGRRNSALRSRRAAAAAAAAADMSSDSDDDDNDAGRAPSVPFGSLRPAAALPLPPSLLSPSASSSAASSSSRPVLWRELRGFRAHRFVVRSCFAGPGSSVLLSGSEDGLVHAWAVRTPHTSPPPFASESHEHAPPDPALLGRLRGHTATINALASTQLPNGAYVFASAADDYTIRLWRLHTKRGHGASSDLDEE
jgi:hypothetical protein